IHCCGLPVALTCGDMMPNGTRLTFTLSPQVQYALFSSPVNGNSCGCVTGVCHASMKASMVTFQFAVTTLATQIAVEHSSWRQRLKCSGRGARYSSRLGPCQFSRMNMYPP